MAVKIFITWAPGGRNWWPIFPILKWFNWTTALENMELMEIQKFMETSLGDLDLGPLL
jgi:hypothetical protein